MMIIRSLAAAGLTATLLFAALPASAEVPTATDRTADPEDVNRNTRIRQVKLPSYILERRANALPSRGRIPKSSAEYVGKTAAERLTRAERALFRQRDARQAQTLRIRLQRMSETGATLGQ